MKKAHATFKDTKPNPPELRGGLPLLGHTVDFVSDTIGLLERARRECGNVARFRVLGKDMVLLTSADVHEAFFRAPNGQLSPPMTRFTMLAIRS